MSDPLQQLRVAAQADHAVGPSVLDGAELSPLEQAILRTVTYADVFDYPLTLAEVHRYLIGQTAPLGEVAHALTGGSRLVPGYLVRQDGFLMLSGREAIMATRRRRQQVAQQMWPRALYWGAAIARLPFVRMVAVTGALAVDNVEPEADLDYLIVTRPDRVWLCRALVVGLVRLAARRGDIVCPNYLISERALVLEERNFFTAREVVQMVPLAGLKLYDQLRRVNQWTAEFLPNAEGLPRAPEHPEGVPARSQAVAEAMLLNPVAGWLDRWEMTRKVRKFQQQHGTHPEAAFSRDWCKGHFDGNGQRIIHAYHERLRGLESAPAEAEVAC